MILACVVLIGQQGVTDGRRTPFFAIAKTGHLHIGHADADALKKLDQETALHTHESPYEIEMEGSISWSSVRRIAKHDLPLKTYKLLSGLGTPPGNNENA